jgi:hypothetical protein
VALEEHAAMKKSDSKDGRAQSSQPQLRLPLLRVFCAHDLGYGIPLFEASVDFLIVTHALYHTIYTAQELRTFRAKAFGSVSPGSIMRIVVPDLEFITSLYQHGHRDHALPYFFRETVSSN